MPILFVAFLKLLLIAKHIRAKVAPLAKMDITYQTTNAKQEQLLQIARHIPQQQTNAKAVAPDINFQTTLAFLILIAPGDIL